MKKHTNDSFYFNFSKFPKENIKTYVTIIYKDKNKSKNCWIETTYIDEINLKSNKDD